MRDMFMYVEPETERTLSPFVFMQQPVNADAIMAFG